MNIKRYIAGLLSVCFSVFLGHNLVPHHHHSEVFNSPIATNCPVEHGDQHGHDHDSDAEANEHPTHCHAFNDVVFEKYNTPVRNPWGSQVHSMLVSGQTIVPELPLDLVSSQYIILKLLCSSHTDIGTRSLRGPPAFV